MKKIALTGLLILCACQPFVSPKSPAQAVFEAQGVYHAALKAEVTYAKLPRCMQGGPTICSDINTIRQVKNIDIAAWGAIQASQKTVRTPGFAENTLQSAAVAAVNAANAFASVTSQLKVR